MLQHSWNASATALSISWVVAGGVGLRLDKDEW
jgi:hypothetical protein